eukprot:6608455-Prymnesium_polylepis.1
MTRALQCKYSTVRTNQRPQGTPQPHQSLPHAHRPDARALHTAPARPHRRLTARAAPSPPEQHPCKKTECCRHAAAPGAGPSWTPPSRTR